MASVADGAPPSKKAKLPANFDSMPDEMLAKIFRYLGIPDRLQAAAVCKKWRNAARLSSTETLLHLDSVSNVTINSILGLCPLASQIVAQGNLVVLEEDCPPAVCENLRTLQLYDVRVSITDTGSNSRNALQRHRLASAFFSSFPHLQELVSCYVRNACDNFNFEFPIDLPQSIRRLFLIIDSQSYRPNKALPHLLRHLHGLEAVGLTGLLYKPDSLSAVLSGIARIQQLRELCLFACSVLLEKVADVCCKSLPNLEVLIYASLQVHYEGLAQLITSHPTLKILLVAGTDYSIEEDDQLEDLLPQRQLHVNGVKLPFSNVYVGGDVASYYRFARPLPETANFQSIDCPLPEYLTKPEVAAVFSGSWLAQLIASNDEKSLTAGGYDQQIYYSTTQLRFYDPIPLTLTADEV